METTLSKSKLHRDNEANSSTASASNYSLFEYKRSRSNSPSKEPNYFDLSYMDLEQADLENYLVSEKNRKSKINIFLLNNNLLKDLSPITLFHNIETLDISSNQIKRISIEIFNLTRLRNFIAKDNMLEDTSLPKEFGYKLNKLEVVNLSGNLFKNFPYQLLEIRSLKEIYLGGNKICGLPKSYENLQRLEILYLGGNNLNSIPEEMSQLRNLTSLNLSNNKLSHLPNQLAKLKKIKSLSLHGNNLSTLPIELVKLNLQELSLRNNPLVNRFAKEFTYNVPSLLELSARSIKSNNVSYKPNDVPKHLNNYLQSAQCCLNPKCGGVYFTSRVEHIKFVDFCGKFRVPLIQYLCSSSCNEKISHSKVLISDSSSDSDSDLDLVDENKRLKKILIG